MAQFNSGLSIGKVICEALGIDPTTTTRITLDCKVGSAATVDVYGLFAESDEAKVSQLKTNLRKYELREINGGEGKA